MPAEFDRSAKRRSSFNKRDTTIASRSYFVCGRVMCKISNKNGRCLFKWSWRREEKLFRWRLCRAAEGRRDQKLRERTARGGKGRTLILRADGFGELAGHKVSECWHWPLIPPRWLSHASAASICFASSPAVYTLSPASLYSTVK